MNAARKPIKYRVTLRGSPAAFGQGLIRATLIIKGMDDVEAVLRAKSLMILKHPDRPVSAWRAESAVPINPQEEKAA